MTLLVGSPSGDRQVGDEDAPACDRCDLDWLTGFPRRERRFGWSRCGRLDAWSVC